MVLSDAEKDNLRNDGKFSDEDIEFFTPFNISNAH